MSFTYITKPVQIEAVSSDILHDMGTDATAAIPKWLMTAFVNNTIRSSNRVPNQLYCITKNDEVRINPGDMLIRLADGEIYPCDLQVFNSKYEKLPEVADKHPYN